MMKKFNENWLQDKLKNFKDEEPSLDSVLDDFDREGEEMFTSITDKYVRDMYENGMPFDDEEFIQGTLGRVRASIEKFKASENHTR